MAAKSSVIQLAVVVLLITLGVGGPVGSQPACLDEFVLRGNNLYPVSKADGERVVSLGPKDTWQDCQTACSSSSKVCKSWTYFFANASKALRQSCFGRTDEHWDPQLSDSTVASGVNCKSPPATALPNAPPPNVQFSWDHVPVFIHTSNTTGPFNDQALQIMAKFPIVTIEKYQGPNSGYHYPAEKWVCCEEDRIVDTLKSVKKINPNITGIFYYNMVLDFPQYRLHENFAKNESWWLHDQHGNVVRVAGGGHGHADLLVYDTRQKTVADLFMNACLDLVPTGAVDGCFVDRPVDGIPDTDTPEKYLDLITSHITTLQEFQNRLGNGPLVANHGYSMPGVNAVMIEGFAASEESIETLQWSAKRGKLVEAHMSGGDCDSDEGIHNHLAAFLIGAGEYSYFGCGPWFRTNESSIATQWKASYDKPLGAPLGPAVKTGQVYTRKFASGTAVQFDCSSKKGEIHWSPES
ncbi:uncharacterized protein LOC135813611 [Sycon ciliatum]|uniref:uncharacterized protein LOC135813611 n=1 Tax=Sycon ciliatum TaxID=27933 RepID=UPI0031F5F455